MIEFNSPSSPESLFVLYDTVANRFARMLDTSNIAAWIDHYSTFITHFPTRLAAKNELDFVQRRFKNAKIIIVEVQTSYTFKEVK